MVKQREKMKVTMNLAYREVERETPNDNWPNEVETWWIGGVNRIKLPKKSQKKERFDELETLC